MFRYRNTEDNNASQNMKFSHTNTACCDFISTSRAYIFDGTQFCGVWICIYYCASIVIIHNNKRRLPTTKLRINPHQFNLHVVQNKYHKLNFSIISIRRILFLNPIRFSLFCFFFCLARVSQFSFIVYRDKVRACKGREI